MALLIDILDVLPGTEARHAHAGQMISKVYTLPNNITSSDSQCDDNRGACYTATMDKIKYCVESD